MTVDEIRALASDLDPDILFLDGHDQALLGLGCQFNTYFSIYSTRLVLEGLMADAMDYEEAVEFFDFNIGGEWVGPHTPVFLLDAE